MMKVSVTVAREEMRKLASVGAVFDWNGSSVTGTWLGFEIKVCYAEHVERMLDRISDDWAYQICEDSGLARFDMFDFTKDSTKEKKQLMKVRQWLTRRSDNPIPMRTMECVVLRETNKAVHVKLSGHLRPASTCNHCGRRLTHPVSLLYGLGPVCGGHFHINPCHSEEELKRRYSEMAKKMASVTWEGWIPKSQIESLEVVS